LAVVKGSVIGYLSGKLGQLAARTTNGRTILSARPTSFKVSYVAALVEIRKKFASTVAFVKVLCRLSTLKEIWSAQEKGKLSTFNYVVQKNFDLVDPERPTVDNILTPGGFPCPVDTVVFAADKVTVNLKVMSPAWHFEPNERDLSACGLIVYYNPIDPEDKPYEIISLSGEIDAVDFELPNTIEHLLDQMQQNIAARYQKKILYYMVATRDLVSNGVVQYSDTYTEDV
jgi:hypothetical protein